MKGRCIKCNSPVVNKKYQLCQQHNYERLHQGKSQQQVYRERNEKRNKSNSSAKIQKEQSSSIPLRTHSNKKRLSNVSDTNRYRCSDGTTVTKIEINRNYQRTCDEIRFERDPVCQGTGRTDLPLSFSHTISRKRCQQLGKSELVWDKENIEVESYEPPCSNPISAHNIWESASLQVKKTLLNFERKLQYIKVHDPQSWYRYQDDSHIH